MLFPTVILTGVEVASGQYEMVRMDDDMRLKKRAKWIPKLAERRGVCIYYEPRKEGCSIYEARPKACRRATCRGTQYEKEWLRLRG